MRKDQQRLNTELNAIVEELQPVLFASERFWEGMHLYAVEQHRQGRLELARMLYETILPRLGPFSELRGWVTFKMAEMALEAGDASAERGFREALEALPELSKAKIMLAPKNEPLRIVLGREPQWPDQGIPVSFHFNAPELWAYYFGKRPLDVLYISPPALVMRFNCRIFAKVLNEYFAPDGSLVMALSPNNRQSFSVPQLLKLCQDTTLFRAEMRKTLDALCEPLGESG